MFVNIEKNSPLITEKFICFLVKTLRRLILLQCTSERLSNINTYLSHLGVLHTAQEIIFDGVKNIGYKEFENYYCIYMLENTYMSGEKTSTYNLCKLIDKGAFDRKPLNIFSNSFDEIKSDIKKYFDIFCFMPF